MELSQGLIAIGICTLIAGLIFTFLPNSNKTLGTIVLGVGVVFIGVGAFYKNYNFADRREAAKRTTVTVISNEVGMDAVSADEDTIRKLDNNTNCQMYFKDGDNIYLCDVKFENGARNYYFTSDGKTIPLLKSDGSAAVS